MPYFLLLRMIEERNIMNSAWKEASEDKKKGGRMSMSQVATMGGVVIERE